MMSLKTSLLGVGIAGVAALVLSGRAMAQPGGPMAGPTTGILAIGHVTPKFTPKILGTALPEELRATVKLYLDGKISTWYSRKDKPGVIFLFTTSDPKEARQLLAALPFGRDGVMDFDLIPVGPLAPLGLVLNVTPG